MINSSFSKNFIENFIFLRKLKVIFSSESIRLSNLKFLDSYIWRTNLNDLLIEAKSDTGVVIFSKIFTVDELETLKYKITIQ